MQKISDFMTRNVQVVRPDESLQRAAQVMDELNVGALPVCDADGLVGMITDRDITIRATAAGLPADTRVAEVMTDDPLAVGITEDLETCMALMRRHGFRHLPVCHDGHLVGIVSLRDILLHDLNEKDDEVRMMRAYIHSMPDA